MQKTCVQTGNTTLPLWPAAGYQTLGFKHCSAQQASTTMNQVSFSLFNPPSPPGSSWPHLITLSSILIPKMTRVTEVIKVRTPTWVRALPNPQSPYAPTALQDQEPRRGQERLCWRRIVAAYSVIMSVHMCWNKAPHERFATNVPRPDFPMGNNGRKMTSYPYWPKWPMGMNKVHHTVKCDTSLDSSNQEEPEYVKFYHKMLFKTKIIH